MAPARVSWRRRRAERAQGMIESALTLPVFLLLLFMTIDLGRGVYTWVIIGQDAEIAARQAALPDNQASDCSSINAVTTAGNGITIAADPHSLADNTQPASTPTQNNSGYLYLNPAQATADPPASHCTNTNPGNGSPARPHGTVSAQVGFVFVPWTPIVSQLLPTLSMTASATVETQY
ncbi:MAG: pilus assembly protein [Candidatus Dormibacteraeota bacterium]|nr:pilus assembly protein [Candidatus Dormibacteraeota bacterium]